MLLDKMSRKHEHDESRQKNGFPFLITLFLHIILILVLWGRDEHFDLVLKVRVLGGV
jgi:hypothetical protein